MVLTYIINIMYVIMVLVSECYALVRGRFCMFSVPPRIATAPCGRARPLGARPHRLPLAGRYARKKKDKDTSLPTMVKLEYSASGRPEEEWERDGRERSDVTVGGLASVWLGGLGSPPAVTPQCSADV